MKALILAAGYGTRFQRDLSAHQDDSYRHLVGLAKPLLPVAGYPLVTHWVHLLLACEEVSGIYVVVNAKYYEQFKSWSADFPSVELVCEGSHSNEERLGAVACIQVAVKHFSIEEDLIVIGGDTLFLEDFVLSNFIGKFLSMKGKGGALVPCYQCADEDTRKCGIVEVNGSGQITVFLEKPAPTETQSRLACPCFYILSEKVLNSLSQFLLEKKDSPLKERDATGHFVKYLSDREAVYTCRIAGRFDVGGLEAYIQCCEQYKPSL